MRIGSLFSGYGGLDMAVQSVLGGEVAWVSDIEPASCQVLAAHHPGVPNLGDITVIDWATVPPIDVLTGGYPCQPFSHAGKRKGTNDERHLWPYVRDAIRVLRPRLAVLENVYGHVSMGLADVIGDLVGLGYGARWGVVRASDAGAPHARARVFITAYPHGDGPVPAPAGGAEGRQELGQGQPEAGDRLAVWGGYAPAIRRWERITGRPCPEPTRMTERGDRRLNPLLSEWMMGLPAGHVTGHGLRPAQELKMLGNGVVPQQAALALRMLGVAS